MKRIFGAFQPFAGKLLGPLEQRLLQDLWTRGSATVRELVDEGDHKLAYTTVMTTLDRLYKKRVLSRVAEGKAFRYSPRYTLEELQKMAAENAISQLFGPDSSSRLPLSYLVEILSGHDTKSLDDLQDLVERKRRELRSQQKGSQSKRERRS
jgi:predicted transcriptional regulator